MGDYLPEEVEVKCTSVKLTWMTRELIGDLYDPQVTPLPPVGTWRLRPSSLGPKSPIWPKWGCGGDM
jgi:hypothetical protein